MKKAIGITVIVLIFLYWLGQPTKSIGKNDDNETYLSNSQNDPWVTTKINEILIKTPEDLKLTSNTVPENFRDIYKEMSTYSIENKRYSLMVQSVSFQSSTVKYNLDKGAEGIINNVLYTLKCKDMKFEKLNSDNDFVVYEAVAKCNEVWKTMDLKIVLLGNRAYSTFILYKATDTTFVPTAERILNSISKIKKGS